MSADRPTPETPAHPGLPPVTPPSGRFIAQLFLVPGLIVVIAVLVILAVNYLFVSGKTTKHYLNKLDSDNADIRWRGASDLAQEIKRKESTLKADPVFALDLAARLRVALADLLAAEADMQARRAKQTPAEQTAALRKLEPQRLYVEFLASALGDFFVPVGAPILCDMMTAPANGDPTHDALRRRKASWALANLGASVKGFTTLPADQRQPIVEQLEQETQGADPERVRWARTALYYLAPDAASADLAVVDRALAQAAADEDRLVRAQVAMALNFWDGPLVEPTLLRLARDNGFGTLLAGD